MKNRKKLWIAIIFFSFVLGVLEIKQRFLIIHNKSLSLPNHWYVVRKHIKPAKGDIFIFRVTNPNNYKQGEKFIKIVAGVSGDEITIKNRNFYINNQFVGYAKTETISGKAIDMTDAGIIPEGFYFASTPHKDSYDSRYKEIGLVNEKNIIGTVIYSF